MSAEYKCLSLAVLFGALAVGASGYRLLNKIPVPGQGSWDYVTVDSAARRIYLSHETQVRALGADTHRVVGTIPNPSGVHGVAVASEFGHGFISAGLAGSVIIVDLTTLKVVGEVKAEKKPDCILYDAASKRVFAMNGESSSATVIDPGDGKVEKIIPLGGGSEFSISDGQANIFVNLKDKSQLARIDSRTMIVKDYWSLAPCEAPASLGFDAVNRRLFVGCRSKLMAVVDADSGRVVATYPIGDHVDASIFDSDSKLVFNSTGEGNVAVFHQDSADKYRLVETIRTNPGSKTMGFDLETHQLFIPANISGTLGLDWIS